jgi:hypothetical protein
MWGLAILLLLAGVFLVWTDSADRRRARLVAKTPTTPIASAVSGQRVELLGRAAVAEEGTIPLPLPLPPACPPSCAS